MMPLGQNESTSVMPDVSAIMPDLSNYSMQQFENDILAFKPRTFDTYILPAFMMYFAFKSKGAMGRTVRRMLFVAGIYMVYRNYAQYRSLVNSIQSKLASGNASTVEAKA